MTPPLPASVESNRYGAHRRMSKGAWALAIALHLIVMTLLILQKSPTFVQMADHGLNAFMLPATKEGTDEEKTEQRQKKQHETTRHAEEQPPPPPAVAPPPPEVPAPSNLQMPFIQMSSTEFSSSDISKIASQRKGTGQSADSRPTSGPGEGPGGVMLYPADWYREPTNTELGTYVPASAPRAGWGQIACKTVERYHVDECYILGESPRGSGLGRAVLNAAWQFLVLPPRRNGQSLVGTWVRIQITYTQKDGFSAR